MDQQGYATSGGINKLVTRFLGPSGYGSYALLISFGTLWQLVADFGLYLQLTRSIAEKPDRQTELINTIFSLRLVLLVIAFATSFVVAMNIPSLATLKLPLALIALGLIFQSLSQLYMGLFQYQQRMWRATLGDILGRSSQIVSVIFFGFKSAALTGMSFAFAIGCGVALLVHQTITLQQTPRFKITGDKWKEIIIDSWPLAALLLLNAIYFRIDTVILSLFRSSSEVGWYSLAYRIIESILFLPAMFGGLLLPRISETVTRHPEQATRYISQGLTILVAAATFIVSTLILRAPAVITFIADSSFLPAAPLLVILSGALACMFLGNLFGFSLIALQRQKTLLALYAFLAVANTVSNLLTIPRWGATAAAIITLLTEVVATAVSAWVVYHAIPYRLPARSLAACAVALVVSSSIYWILPSHWPLLLAVTLAAAGYVATIVITRGVTYHQLSALVGPPLHG